MEKKRKTLSIRKRLMISHIMVTAVGIIFLAVLAKIKLGDDSHEILKLSLLAGVICFVLSGIVSSVVSTYFEGQIDKFRKFSRRISEYDFSEDIVDNTNNEFGEMLVLLNDTQVMIRDAVEKLTGEAGTVKSISGELHEAADLAVGRLTKVVDMLDSAETMDKEQIKELYNEINAAVTYMEQMRTASAQQGEIGEKHMERLGRFRIEKEKKNDYRAKETKTESGDRA